MGCEGVKGGGEKRDCSAGSQVVGNPVEPDGEVSAFVFGDEGGDDGKSKEND